MASYTLQLVAQPNLKNKNKKIAHHTEWHNNYFREQTQQRHYPTLTLTQQNWRTEQKKSIKSPNKTLSLFHKVTEKTTAKTPHSFFLLCFFNHLRTEKIERERECVCVCVCVRDFFNKERIRVVWEWKKVLFIDRKQRGNLFLSYGMPKEEEEHHWRPHSWWFCSFLGPPNQPTCRSL